MNYRAKMKNDVTSFHYYMWNRWNERECGIIFGGDCDHIWSIWLHTKCDIGAFYGMLDNDCRNRLTDRALKLYENDKILRV